MHLCTTDTPYVCARGGDAGGDADGWRSCVCMSSGKYINLTSCSRVCVCACVYACVKHANLHHKPHLRRRDNLLSDALGRTRIARARAVVVVYNRRDNARLELRCHWGSDAASASRSGSYSYLGSVWYLGSKSASGSGYDASSGAG